jgi:hypothetical protein
LEDADDGPNNWADQAPPLQLRHVGRDPARLIADENLAPAERPAYGISLHSETVNSRHKKEPQAE